MSTSIHATELAYPMLRERLGFWLTLGVAAVASYVVLCGFLAPATILNHSLGERLAFHGIQTLRVLREGGGLMIAPESFHNPFATQALLATFLLRWFFVLLGAVPPALQMRNWARMTTARRRHARTISGQRYYEHSDAVRALRQVFSDDVMASGSGLTLVPDVYLPRSRETRTGLAVGLPGGGKSTLLNHIGLQALARGDKIVLHDTSGDVVARWPGAVWLLNPLNSHSHAWDIARDCRDENDAREVMAHLISAEGRGEEHWPRGAQEIGVGVTRTLQVEHGTTWGFSELCRIGELQPRELHEFAVRYHPPARPFLALDGEEFTKTANSYVTTFSSGLNPVVRPLAEGWGDLAPAARLSLRDWLADGSVPPNTLILQRDADKPKISEAWMPIVLGVIAGFCASNKLAESKSRRIWMILDEFAQMGLVSRFAQLAEVGRKKGLCCLLAVQNYSQLADIYGSEKANNIIDLAEFKFIFYLEAGPTSEMICSQLIKPSRMTSMPRTPKGATPAQEAVDAIAVVDAAEIASLAQSSGIGVEGIMLYRGKALRLLWTFPEMPIQR